MNTNPEPWCELHRQLTLALRSMQGGEYLVLSRRAGWGYAQFAKGDRGSPNHHRRWAAPAPHAMVACVALRALVDVFGVPSPTSLEHEGFVAGGRAIEHPLLGLTAA